MQFPINIVLRRSRLFAWGLILLAALLVAVFLGVPRSTGLQAGFFLPALILLWLASRHLTPGIVALRLYADGTLAARIGAAQENTDEVDEWLALRCLPGATVHPWLTALRLQHDDGRRWSLVLFADSADRQASRRLRVFLRWQPATGAHGLAAPVNEP